MAEKQKFDTNRMLEGPLFPALISYSIPLIIASLIQAAFNMADQLALSWLGGNTSVAAVGACTAICNLIVNLFCGLAGGVSVVLARYIGANDVSRVKETVGTTMISSLGLGILATSVSVPLASWFLTVTNCPGDCFDGSLVYLIIYFCSMPSMLVYNFGSTVIRVGGDSRSPLFYMIYSGLLNVVMNIVLCLVWENKVAAVAVATLGSQTMGAVLVVIHLMKMKGILRLDLRDLSYRWGIFGKIIRYGIPTAINGCLFSISNMQIQSAVNSYGSQAVAGASAASNIEGLVASFPNGFSVTALTFCGQNLGAKNKKRVGQTIRQCLLISVSTTFVLSMLVFLFRHLALGVYLHWDEASVAYGAIRMNYICKYYAIAAINNVLGAMVQSFGYAWIVMTDGIATILLFRIFWMTFIYPKYQTFDCLMFCYTVSWSLMLLTRTTISALLWRRYKKKDKLRRI